MGRTAEDAFELSVGQHNLSLRIEQYHRVGSRLHDAFKELL